jgi:hypothetical protein
MIETRLRWDKMRGQIQLFTMPLDLERARQFNALKASEACRAGPIAPSRKLEAHQMPRL